MTMECWSWAVEYRPLIVAFLAGMAAGMTIMFVKVLWHCVKYGNVVKS